jgi:hypothetical protein
LRDAGSLRQQFIHPLEQFLRAAGFVALLIGREVFDRVGPGSEVSISIAPLSLTVHGLAIIAVLMAMRPTRPPRKRGPILYGQQYRSLHILKDATIHPVESAQETFGADEPDLGDYRCKGIAFMLENRVIGILLGLRCERHDQDRLSIEFSKD